jgi:proteasome lid subunit RPN8/RPN11
MQIARSVLSAIRRHVVAAYPAEGCGFLVGAREPNGEVVISHQLPVNNRRMVDGAERTRYLISPDDFRIAERDALADGLLVVGMFHSHPDVAAQPSSYDREHAWPWYRYLIVSVVGGVVKDERAWELNNDRRSFVEHAVQVKEP